MASEPKTTPIWKSNARRHPMGGLSDKAIQAYNEATGSRLQRAVSTHPRKLKKDSEELKRQKNFCARSYGQFKRMNPEKQKDPNTPIAKALQRWRCDAHGYDYPQDPKVVKYWRSH